MDRNQQTNPPQNLEILAGAHLPEIREVARRWYMHELGTATFDDGEAQTPEHLQAETAVYYQNQAPAKMHAFMHEVRQQYPDVQIGFSPLGPSDGQDMSRFEDEANLQLDDLELPPDQLEQ